MGCNCSNSRRTSKSSSSYNNRYYRRKPETPADSTTYRLESFLPRYNGESYIQIRDKDGIIRHKIYNNTLTVRYVHDNVLFLKTRSENKKIPIDFPTDDEASEALVEFSNMYNELRENYQPQD